MFRFQVITLFPEMVEAAMNGGVFRQAQKKNILSLSTLNPRDFTSDIHRTVDDRPFGGGDGMVMLIEPLRAAIACAHEQSFGKKAKVIYLSPQGAPLTHEKARSLSAQAGLILLCGRYGGVDQRLINESVDEEISVGDYVLSGGELAACVLMDAISRFIPGVLGHAQSADNDSFADGLLEAPNFTRPSVYSANLASPSDGQPTQEKIFAHAVPEVLMGGNHKVIEEWKRSVSTLVTLKKRPDLLVKHPERKALIASAKKTWALLTLEEKNELGLKDLNLEQRLAEAGVDEGGKNV